MLPNDFDLGEFILKVDPLKPHPQLFATATEMLAATAAGLAQDIPWPDGFAPTAAALPASPDPSAALPKADALVVTWTAAEARTLARLFTPGVQLEQWYKYDRNLEQFIPNVTGTKAPFNDPKLALYYHHLGLYYITKIGSVRVICFKSGLHMDYDGPALPVRDLWKQIIAESGAKLVITTGTGGGIGTNVKLGDAIIAGHTVFDCTTKFKTEPFAKEKYPTNVVSGDPTTGITAAMLTPNALKLPGGQIPKFFYPGASSENDPKVVSTDFFAYDDTSDSNGLQELGNVCDMGDAVLGLVMNGLQSPPMWTAIRNVSDPQMDGNLPKKERDAAAAKIYLKYGAFTTASSVLASWGVITTTLHPVVNAVAAHTEELMLPLITTATPALPTVDISAALLQIAASTDLTSRTASPEEIPEVTKSRLARELDGVNVPFDEADISYRVISYADELSASHSLFLAQVSLDSPEAFRGAYLFEHGDLITKHEFVSS